MTGSENPVAIDLQRHFADRLQRLLHVSASTCVLADISDADIVAMHMSVLLAEITRAAEYIGVPEDKFMQLCLMGYRINVEERGEPN